MKELETEIVSLFYHNKLSITQINRKFRPKTRAVDVAKIICQSQMRVENDYLVIPSVMNCNIKLK